MVGGRGRKRSKRQKIKRQKTNNTLFFLAPQRQWDWCMSVGPGLAEVRASYGTRPDSALLS